MICPQALPVEAVDEGGEAENMDDTTQFIQSKIGQCQPTIISTADQWRDVSGHTASRQDLHQVALAVVPGDSKYVK